MALGKKTGGRQKGSVNKTTASVKQALVEAFEELGGVKSLVEFGRENPRDFYALWVKIMPTEVKQDLTSSDGSIMPVAIQVVGIDDSQE